jgi:hypothetical protein
LQEGVERARQLCAATLIGRGGRRAELALLYVLPASD